MKLKNEFYKPRDLSEDSELDNIVDAILNQQSMAMDSGYVADVSLPIHEIRLIAHLICFFFQHNFFSSYYYIFFSPFDFRLIGDNQICRW